MKLNRLLIIDDEPGITRIIEVAARQLDFDVLAIHDIDQFEKALGQIEPTVIFLDITMPGRDGLELIAQLAAQSYPAKIVVISGSDPRYIQMTWTIATQRGLVIAGTLVKPFRKKDLLDLLTTIAVPVSD